MVILSRIHNLLRTYPKFLQPYEITFFFNGNRFGIIMEAWNAGPGEIEKSFTG